MKTASILKPFKRKARLPMQDVPDDASVLPFDKFPQKAPRLSFFPRFGGSVRGQPPSPDPPSVPHRPLAHSRSEHNLGHKRSESFGRSSISSFKLPGLGKRGEKSQDAHIKPSKFLDEQYTAPAVPYRPPPLEFHSSAFYSTPFDSQMNTACSSSSSSTYPDTPPPKPSLLRADSSSTTNSVPELEGVWEGFLQDVQDDLDSPERMGFESPTRVTDGYFERHMRQGSMESVISDFSVYDALPHSFSYRITGSTPDLAYLLSKHGIPNGSDMPDVPDVPDISLAMFPTPPTSPSRQWPHRTEPLLSPIYTGSGPPSLASASPSNSSAASSMLSTPTTPRAPSHQFSESPVTRKGIFVEEEEEASSSPIGNSQWTHHEHLPLRAAKSSFNLRSSPSPPLTHKATSSEPSRDPYGPRPTAHHTHSSPVPVSSMLVLVSAFTIPDGLKDFDRSFSHNLLKTISPPLRFRRRPVLPVLTLFTSGMPCRTTLQVPTHSRCIRIYIYFAILR